MKQKPKTGNVLVLSAWMQSGKTKWCWMFEMDGKREFGSQSSFSSAAKAIAHFNQTVSHSSKFEIREER